MEIPNFENKKELYEFLWKNNKSIISAKKARQKTESCIQAPVLSGRSGSKTYKSEPIDVTGINEIIVKPVINTTNVMDSHKDVHFPNLWKKNLSEFKGDRFLLQDHEMTTGNVIAEGGDLDVYTQTYKWRELGYDFEGETQALIYGALVRRKLNPTMFERYAMGLAKFHSVGMYYVKMELAINDPDYEDSYKLFTSKIDSIANKQEVLDNGYFYAVFEAKTPEGSSVLRPSNIFTPTTSVTANNNNNNDSTLNSTVGGDPLTELSEPQPKGVFDFYNELITKF